MNGCIRPPRYRFRALLLGFLLIGMLPAHAALTALHDFCPGFTDARYPQYTSPVVSGSTIYGMTNQGGLCNVGAIFKVNTDGTGYAILHEFTGVGGDGASPMDSLTVDGTVLYGATRNGGLYNKGTIFSLNTDGSGYTILHHFTGGAGDGSEPFGPLLCDAGVLYGTTFYGGTNNLGTVFSMDADGSDFQLVLTFTGANGANPHHDVTLADGWLIGTTQKGGANDKGVIVKVRPDGSDATIIHTFAAGAGNGVEPNGGLVYDGTFLYGMTHQGNNTAGTIYKIKPDGTGFAIMHSCTGAANDASLPDGSLVLSGTTLYGMASRGGAYVMGVAFKIETDGTGFSLLRSFGNDADLDYLLGSFALADGTLYGVAFTGGADDCGGVFKLETDGSGYTELHAFSHASVNGSYPYASPIYSAGKLYGTANMGGSKDSGIVFACNPDGTGFTMLHDFHGGAADGAYPAGVPLASGGRLYGLATSGGPGSAGVVWAMDLDGGNFTLLHAFDGTDGNAPMDGLAISEGTLYGMTNTGGAGGGGVLFKVQTDGTGFSVLTAFTGGAGDGGTPYGTPLLRDGVLYGLTSTGGTHGKGTAYSVKPDGSDFTLLRSFAGGNDDGAVPYGSFISDGTRLYAMTSAGGADGIGVIFSMAPDGTDMTLLHVFTGADGDAPWGALTLVNGLLYGLTNAGGDNSAGVLFSLRIDGTDYTVIESLGGQPDPANPYGTLCSDGDKLYGLGAMGGLYGYGQLFSYDMPYRQPDLHLRAESDGGYTGDDVYSTDGTGETCAITLTGARALYLVHIQNDGDNTETLTVTGSAGSDGWTLAYRTMGETPTDVTAQVTGAGWTTKALNPGQFDLLQVIATPSGAVTAGSPYAHTLTAASGLDIGAIDVVEMSTTLTVVRKTDLAIRNADEDAYIGNNVYNATGVGQSKAQSTEAGVPVTYVFRIQNDGNLSDTFTVSGPASGAGWTVKYYSVSGDITGAVTGAGWSTGALAPGAVKTLWAVVKSSTAVAGDAQHVLVLTAISQADGTESDIAKATTTNANSYQPDLLVRTAAETSYTGSNLYTADGTGQTKALTVAGGAAATYLVRLQNDGNASDSFRLTAPAAAAGWTVRYFAAGLGEITADVTGAGWVSGALARGAAIGLWFIVSPTSGVASDASLDTLLTAASTHNGAAVDAGKGVTTRQ